MSTVNLDQEMLDELRRENEILHAENALKLKQILGLEQLLYDNRVIDAYDGSPCWCCNPIIAGTDHSDACIKARKATEMFWRK